MTKLNRIKKGTLFFSLNIICLFLFNKKLFAQQCSDLFKPLKTKSMTASLSHQSSQPVMPPLSEALRRLADPIIGNNGLAKKLGESPEFIEQLLVTHGLSKEAAGKAQVFHVTKDARYKDVRLRFLYIDNRLLFITDRARSYKGDHNQRWGDVFDESQIGLHTQIKEVIQLDEKTSVLIDKLKKSFFVLPNGSHQIELLEQSLAQTGKPSLLKSLIDHFRPELETLLKAHSLTIQELSQATIDVGHEHHTHNPVYRLVLDGPRSFLFAQGGFGGGLRFIDESHKNFGFSESRNFDVQFKSGLSMKVNNGEILFKHTDTHSGYNELLEMYDNTVKQPIDNDPNGVIRQMLLHRIEFLNSHKELVLNLLSQNKVTIQDLLQMDYIYQVHIPARETSFWVIQTKQSQFYYVTRTPQDLGLKSPVGSLLEINTEMTGNVFPLLDLNGAYLKLTTAPGFIQEKVVILINEN